MSRNGKLISPKCKRPAPKSRPFRLTLPGYSAKFISLFCISDNFFFPYDNLVMTTYNTGTIKMARLVAANIPPSTVQPMVLRATELAPEANANGNEKGIPLGVYGKPADAEDDGEKPQ